MSSAVQQPLFFREPVLINTQEHSGASFVPETDFLFAKETNSIPLTFAEFEQAAVSYPIVFSDTEEPTAVAITGLAGNQNLFVDEQGKWRVDAYIPAYVRKYPFLFLESADAQQLSLCVEKKNIALDNSDRPFFDSGDPSELTKQSLEFCKNFQASWEQTRGVVAKLNELDLLTGRRADIETPTGGRFSLRGFKIIDRDKFNGLSKDVISSIPAAVISTIYSHFVSMSCWKRLITYSDS